MLFDVPMRLEHDPMSEERQAWGNLRPSLPFEDRSFVGAPARRRLGGRRSQCPQGTQLFARYQSVSGSEFGAMRAPVRIDSNGFSLD